MGVQAIDLWQQRCGLPPLYAVAACRLEAGAFEGGGWGVAWKIQAAQLGTKLSRSMAIMS